MVTRREALILIGTLPAGIALASARGATSDSAAAASNAVAIDRELTLRLSDNLASQHWFYAGQRYTENRDRIEVHEDERLRLNILNDTVESRTLAFDGARIQLAPYQSVSLELTIDILESNVIRDTEKNIARVIDVRPSYQVHAMVSA